MTTYSVTYYTRDGRKLADFDRNVSLDYVTRSMRSDEYARAEPSTGPVLWLLGGRQVQAPPWAVAASSATLLAQDIERQRSLMRQAMSGGGR